MMAGNRVPVWLHNLIMRVWERFQLDLVLMPNLDGRLMSLDEWEGYDSCMRPGCGHYRCEHSMGQVWETVYAAPAVEGAEPSFQVGDLVSYPVGCMNGGCKCEGFWTTTDLIAFVYKLNNARINGSWDLEQVPGVTDTDSEIDITVRIDTFTESREETAREAIYTAEQGVREQHPDVLFDFNVRWDKPSEEY